jgi:hypothetical protein
VLEYGFFVSQLGAQRVWILEEEGVGLPSGVLGLTTFRFSRESEAALRASIDICIDEMRKAWLVLPPPTPDGDRGIEDADLGFATTLQEERSRLTETIESLRVYAENKRPRLHQPLTFDSSRSAISAYSEALDRVQRRFWTTTFISSGFWTRSRGRCAGPLWRRENGVAFVRDADHTVMPLSSWTRMVLGATDRNCRLLP